MATHAEQSRSVDLHQTDAISHDGSTVWIAIQSSSNGRRRMNKNNDRDPIVTRSRRDRSPIVPRSRPLLAWNRLHSIGRRSTDDQDHDRGPITARSEPDQDLFQRGIVSTRSDGVRRMTKTMIVARSLHDRGIFEAQIEINLPQFWEPRHRPRESPP